VGLRNGHRKMHRPVARQVDAYAPKTTATRAKSDERRGGGAARHGVRRREPDEHSLDTTVVAMAPALDLGLPPRCRFKYPPARSAPQGIRLLGGY
jgi:hypothetical protein